MTNAYFTDSFRSIKRTLSRFISIVAIVAMGSGLFCGLNAVGPDMINTADEYYKEYNLMDLRLQSYLGLYEEELEQIRQMEGVESVQGSKFVDGYVQVKNAKGEYEGIVDIDGSELTLRVSGLDIDQAVGFQQGADNKDYINRLKLLTSDEIKGLYSSKEYKELAKAISTDEKTKGLGLVEDGVIKGRYPHAPNECVVTCSGLTTPEQFKIGNTIKVSGDDEDISYYLKHDELIIVGVVQTPYWVSYERGVTTAGSGKLGDFVYVSNDAFTEKITYYSEAYVTLEGADEYEAYSDKYNDYVDGMRQKIAKRAESLAEASRIRLSWGLENRVNDAKGKIDAAEITVNQKLDEGRKTLEELYELEKSGEQQLLDAQKLMDEEYSKVQGQLQAGSDQYLAAVNEYNSKVTAVSQGQVEFANKESEYNNKKTQADAAKNQLDEANVQLTIAEKEIKYMKTLITTTQSTLETLQNNQDVAQSDLDLDAMADRLEETNPELAAMLRSASNLTAQGMAADAIVEVDQLLTQYETELAYAQIEYNEGKAEYDKSYAQWEAADAQLNTANIQLQAAKKQLEDAEKQLEAYKEKIQSSGNTLQFSAIEAQTKYMTAQATLALKTAQFQNIKETIASAEAQFAEAEKEANQKLGVVKTEFQKGESLLHNIKEGVGWSVYTRDDNPGFTGYGQAASNMVRLAYIFPTFFFIVSTMVCLTTLTRMVEEERTQLGTLKALGYSNKMISGKYLLYSATASFIGVFIGILVGFIAVPKIICTAWGIMYEMPSAIIQFMPLYLILGVIISLGSTMLAAYLACRKELASVPSVLMRPKPPKAGKRVFLENIDAIWSKLSFTSKVTVRNLFRNKKRFIVTVVGIAGCTALLLAAFGLRDSISGVIDNQYGEGTGIAQYDFQVVLEDGQANYDDSKIVSDINAVDNLTDSMLAYLKVCKGYAENGKEMEVDVLVPENPVSFARFINLKLNEKPVPFTDEGAVITKKLADKTDTKIGDTITVSWTEGSKTVSYDVVVTGIVDNYAFHYVYMTPYYYNQVTNTALSYNYLFCKVADDITQGEKIQLENTVNDMRGVSGSVFTTVVIDNFNNIIKTLNLVILMFIVAAMALAVVVLYNLNNINVNERIRELATLKVLGFYNGEVSAYIYRENVILTFIGVVLGLVSGIPLNALVIGVVDIDTLTFKTRLEPQSFLIAVLFTALMAVLVNVIMHFKLKKISMVESLKSVE